MQIIIVIVSITEKQKKNIFIISGKKIYVTMKNTKKGRSNQVEEILENKTVAQIILRE